MDECYMELALKQAQKAYKIGEIPVGTIIVKDNKVITKAFNKKEKSKCVTQHAEIIAIKKACKKLKNWRLENCILYTTMEPCMMCCGAIMQSRIKKIVYGVKNENYGFTSHLKNIEIVKNVKENQCKKMVQTFFENKR